MLQYILARTWLVVLIVVILILIVLYLVFGGKSKKNIVDKPNLVRSIPKHNDVGQIISEIPNTPLKKEENPVSHNVIDVTNDDNSDESKRTDKIKENIVLIDDLMEKQSELIENIKNGNKQLYHLDICIAEDIQRKKHLVPQVVTEEKFCHPIPDSPVEGAVSKSNVCVKKPIEPESEDDESSDEEESEDEAVEPGSQAPAARGGKKSIGETECCKVMQELYKVPFVTQRPNFLKNPETNRNLELDCYNKDVGIAVEYNGEQHYKWPNFFGMTKEDFIKQHRRDELKRKLCDLNSVYLITVPYTVKPKDIKSYIKDRLPQKKKPVKFRVV